MSLNAPAQSIEVIVEELENGLLLESVKTSNKSTLNGNKTVVLDLNAASHRDIIFMDVTRAAIDLNTIFSLNLSHCNLRSFPDAFAELNLRQLNLSHNQFKSVPNCIEKGLRFLKILDLSRNALANFANEPMCVQKLCVLRINNNHFEDIPQWILEVNCFNLEELYYSFNEVNTLKKSRFRYKSPYRLKKLELRNCLLRSQDVKFLKDIRTLNVLDLSNEHTDRRNCFARYDALKQLFDSPLWDSRLKILYLNDLEISYLPDEMAKLFVLEELYLAKNDLLWLPDAMTQLEKLRILDLSYNQLASLPKDLNNMKNLEILAAPHNCISKTPDFSLTSLKTLDLYDNYLDGDCHFALGCSITQVDLEQNFVDTNSLKIQDYELMKNTLRKLEKYRTDGPKEHNYDCDDLSSGRATTDSECSDSAVEGTFKDMDEEETWSSQSEFCDNGCTSSDNEWTGVEKCIVRRKKIARAVEKIPDWLFEDV